MAPPFLLPRHVRWLCALSLAVLGAGCRPKIGDDCRTSVDCSQSGDRLCDITQPGGYCTVYNCEPGSCPGEAACVSFDARLSPFPECRDDNAFSRFQRAFCMFSCDSDSDCRAGYVCADVSGENVYNAVLIDPSRGAKVCLVAPVAKPVSQEMRSREVCTGSEAAAGSGSE